MLDQTSQMEQIDQYRRWADQDVREHTTIDLPQVARQQRVLGNQLVLAEFAIDECDIAVFIELGAAQFERVVRLDDPAQSHAVVEEARQRRQIVGSQVLRRAARGSQFTPKTFA